MSPRSFLLDDQLAGYVAGHAAQPDRVLQDLAAETAALGPISGMQIGPDQGAFMTLLVRLVGATNAVEVGTFTGYSSICIARGLADGGRLLCCDVSEEYTAVARRYWATAGLADRIDLRIAPALDTLRSLPPDAVIDFAFVDADKTGYLDYYEQLVPRLRPGGLLVADNVLQSGNAAKPPSGDDHEAVVAIRSFNDHVTADERMESVLLPVADGLTLARRC